MKNSLTGLICTCLLLGAGLAPARGQGKQPDPQSTVNSGPSADAAEAGDSQQTPAPPQQTPPQQSPPDAGDDSGQTQRAHIAEPPPPPPKVPDVRRPGEVGYFFDVETWFPKEQILFDRGRASTFTGASKLTMPGKPKYAENAEIGMAVGLHNTLRLVYTNVRAYGSLTTPTDTVAFSQTYTAGTLITSNYNMTHVRLSYEFLTWPYPVGSRKFRLKTLWQVQYTQVRTNFDSPLKYYDSSGNLILDSSGNVASLAAAGTRHIFSPMLGLGAYYYPSRHIRLEANASGFAWPHRYDVWAGDASLNLRLTGHLEIRLGGRAFGFKTSTKGDFYSRGHFASALVGLRWYTSSQ